LVYGTKSEELKYQTSYTFFTIIQIYFYGLILFVSTIVDIPISKKTSIKTKRLEATWNQDYLMKILNIKV